MSPIRLLSAFLLLAALAPAQTVTWTAPGNLATFDDWGNPANWDIGAVPNGSSFTAVINQATPANRNFPDGPYVNATTATPASVTGGGLPIITGADTA